MIFKPKHLQQTLPSSVQNLAKGLERSPPAGRGWGRTASIPARHSIWERTSPEACGLHSKAQVTASSSSPAERATPALLSGSA